jgi:hypothetical protein
LPLLSEKRKLKFIMRTFKMKSWSIMLTVPFCAIVGTFIGGIISGQTGGIVGGIAGCIIAYSLTPMVREKKQIKQ